MPSGPARERVSLVIADVADGRVGIDRLEARERHQLPRAIDLAPMARSLPVFLAGRGEAVHQPQRCGPVTAVTHEGEPFAIGDEIACDLHGADERTMRGLLVIEMEA